MNTTEWMLSGLRLHVAGDHPFGLVEQTERCDLLTTLAKSRQPGVAWCALDIIFQYGYTPDTYDALEAYALNPLAEPPSDYIEICYAVDWVNDYFTGHLFPIVLAGVKNVDSLRFLHEVLDRSQARFRYGALYASAAHEDPELIGKILKLSAQDGEDGDCFMTGEARVLSFCLSRWMERGVLCLEKLSEIYASAPTEKSRLIGRQLLNCAVCRDILQIPFPDAVHVGREQI